MLYQLTIDGRKSVVQSTEKIMLANMYAYIREQRASGRKLADIQYCWRPIRVGGAARSPCQA